MTVLWIETLERLVALVDEKVAAANAEAGEFSHADYDAWRKRHVEAETKLIAFFTNEEAARWSYSGAAYALKMAGIRSSATSGYSGALANWRTAARKQIAKADGFNQHGSGPVPIEPREAP
jgi:hypothetical protein